MFKNVDKFSLCGPNIRIGELLVNRVNCFPTISWRLLPYVICVWRTRILQKEKGAREMRDRARDEYFCAAVRKTNMVRNLLCQL